MEKVLAGVQDMALGIPYACCPLGDGSVLLIVLLANLVLSLSGVLCFVCTVCLALVLCEGEQWVFFRTFQINGCL